MEVSVLQFRGIDKAEFIFSDIVLLAGPNGAGKTSICMAVAAALSGTTVPFLKSNDKGKVVTTLTKAEAGRLVRSGFDMGGVRVTADNSEAAIVWPQAEYKTKGAPPVINLYASGLISLLDMDQKAQIRALSDMIRAIPTDDDIKAEFKALGLTDERVVQLVDKIRLNGWDAVAEGSKEHGAKLKGQWELFAGESYGSDKAGKWIPIGWQDALSETSDAALIEAVANAKQALEKRLQSMAVAENVVDQLKALVASGLDFSSEKTRCEEALGAAIAEISRIEGAIKMGMETLVKVTPAATPVEPAKCPYCKKPLAFMNGALVKAKAVPDLPDQPSQEEMDAAREALRLDQVKRQEQQLVVDMTKRALESAALNMRRSGDAQKRLDEIAGLPPVDDRPIDMFREDVRLCEDRVEAKRKKGGADRAHAQVKANQEYLNLLAPDGMRKRKLLRALDDFNATMAELSTSAGYKLVVIDEDMAIRYGGRNYYLLSASEQYRVRAILAVVAAQSDAQSVVILDGADILDAAGRNGLFTLLSKLNMASLVGMTMNKPEQMPDLGKFGFGASYWVSGGTLKPLAEAVAEAEAAKAVRS